MVLRHIEVRLLLTGIIVERLIGQGYSHPGLEKVYSKTELDNNEAFETDGDSLRKVQDFKV